MGNKEKKFKAESVHLFIAVRRNKDVKQEHMCIRQVIKDQFTDLEVLKKRVELLGGVWRIYRTVSKRKCEPARKWLLKKLIDQPELASSIDSVWRTALLQRECREDKKFLIDVDTEDEVIVDKVRELLPSVLETMKTPNGYHFVTESFDTRVLSEFLLNGTVEIKRDGYIFVCMVGD